MKPPPPSPRDVLHVLGTLRRGGIETWLVQLFRHSPKLAARSRVCLGAVDEDGSGDYREELDTLGIPVHHLRLKPPGLGFVLGLARHMRSAHIRVVHSHVNDLAGLVLLAGKLAGVPVRIAHHHAQRPAHRGRLREGYFAVARRLERQLATLTLSCSRAIADSYSDFGRAPTILPLGIDASPFLKPADRLEIRKSLGISEQSLVLCHVGRFEAVKNHAWLLEILLAMQKRLSSASTALSTSISTSISTTSGEPSSDAERGGAVSIGSTSKDAILLLIGDGPLRAPLEEEVKQRGLDSSLHFLGSRPDVPALLQAADVFVFPSQREGYGLALVEAQMAGLPALASSRVPEEAIFIKERVLRLSLDEPVETWVSALFQLSKLPPLLPREAWARAQAQGYGLENNAERLLEFYRASDSNSDL